MRIGSAIMFLVVILLVCGYLFADNLHIRTNLAQAKQQIADLLDERELILGELEHLKLETGALIAERDEIRQQLILLEGQIKQTQEDKLRVENENVQLRSQLDQIRRLYPMIEVMARLVPQSLEPALLVPLLPVSLAATLVIYRYSQHHKDHTNRQSNRRESHASVKLTEQEVKELIRMRRKG